jgi:RNA recognition motif-containing protein
MQYANYYARTDVRLVIKQGKKPFAFVSYSSEAEAKAAVNAFHHSDLWGCRLNAELAKNEIRSIEIRNRPWANRENDHKENDNYQYEPSNENERDQHFHSEPRQNDSDERTVYVFDVNFATRRGALRKFGERVGPVYN